MNRFLLDTNHLSNAVARVSVVRDQMQQRHQFGDVFGACGPVLCELLVGIVMRKDAQATRRHLDALLRLVRIWPVDLDVADLYGELYHELKKSGRALSQVDIIQAAMCRNAKLTLLTADQDFNAIPDIKTENWLGS